jgi:hypothetical protein
MALRRNWLKSALSSFWHASCSSSGTGNIFWGMKMTNITSIAGGTVWMLVAALLICAALEPVPVEADPVRTAQAATIAAAA